MCMCESIFIQILDSHFSRKSKKALYCFWSDKTLRPWPTSRAAKCIFLFLFTSLQYLKGYYINLNHMWCKYYLKKKKKINLLCSPPCSWSLALSALRDLISHAGSSGSGERGPHCRVAQHSPQGQALCSRSPGANPLPCIPASVHVSSYGCHMWSCRKADAVFPFVKSGFWKAVSILMARVESLSVKGRGQSCAVLNANTATSHHHCVDVLSLQSGDMALSGAVTLVQAIRAHTVQRHRHARSLDADLSVAEQFLCQSSADADGQYGGEDACQKQKSLNGMTDSRRASPAPLPSLPAPAHLTHRSLGSHDKPDTCQSYTPRQAGEDSSIQSSTCSELTSSLTHTQQVY